jgi:molybdenum cofactor cytidylyltransferase
MPIAAVVLAAGSSSRLGSAKQMARLGGQTLLERAVKTAVEAGLRPVFVVIAAGQETAFGVADVDNLPEDPVVLPGDPVVVMVVNPEAAEGMASSIRAGVRAAQAAEGIVVMACDQPAVTAEHLRAVTAEHRRALADGSDEVVASTYAGRKGVPAYFPASAFAELLELRGDTGARGLLQGARAVELQGGELDVDTVEDLEQAVRLYSRPPGP